MQIPAHSLQIPLARRLMPLAWALAVAIVLIMVLTWGVLQVQVTLAGFLNSESVWSKAQKQAVIDLDNYAIDGSAADLASFRNNYELLKSDAGTLSAKVLADYTRATLNQGGNVPRIPPYRAGGGLSWQGRAVDANLLYVYVGRQTKFGAFDTPTPHYNQLNAQIAWRPFEDHPGIELAVVGQNLTNDVQRAATALNKDVVEMPGRNVRFVLRVATF